MWTLCPYTTLFRSGLDLEHRLAALRSLQVVPLGKLRWPLFSARRNSGNLGDAGYERSGSEGHRDECSAHALSSGLGCVTAGAV
jgi:hypothetical protein